MLDSFLTFINQQKWDLANRRTLLAVSGGVDSVALLHLFHKAGFELGIAHCNFGLRDVESDEDERFVNELAKKYSCPIYIKRFKTKTFASAHSVSTQMAARDLRYQWFSELAEDQKYEWIATAHHANDSIETTLLNLTRGTGLAGVHGINSMAGKVIRPLLFASRAEIEGYVEQNDLSWREDRTNASTDYKRNLVRHKVIPLLEKMNPGFVRTSRVTSERLRAADMLLTSFLNSWQKEAIIGVGGQIRIGVDELLSSVEPTYRLWFVLQNYGFGYQQVQQIFESVSKSSGKLFHSASHTVLKDREFLIVREKGRSEFREQLTIWDGNEAYFLEDQQLVVSRFDKLPDFEVIKESHIAFLDRDLLLFPLTVRCWDAGDLFFPFGMGGRKKKVSDLLIDSKVSLFEKERVKVLLNGDGKIIWVMGFRTDERFKISANTQKILKVRIDE